MRSAFWILVACLACPGCRASGAGTPRAAAADLDRLTGAAWSGELSYLDYSSGKKTTIPAGLRVERKSGAESVWLMHLSFPDEPQADGTSELVLSDDGRLLDGERVIERREQEGGVLCIVTETEGQDDDKPATLRHVYRIGAHEASAGKFVRTQGTRCFFERNAYRWRR